MFIHIVYCPWALTHTHTHKHSNIFTWRPTKSHNGNNKERQRTEQCFVYLPLKERKKKNNNNVSIKTNTDWINQCKACLFQTTTQTDCETRDEQPFFHATYAHTHTNKYTVPNNSNKKSRSLTQNVWKSFSVQRINSTPFISL